MPPNVNIADGSLGMRFWAESNLNTIEADYTKTVNDNHGIAVAPERAEGETFANASNATMSRMSANGGDARYHQVTGRAKALGASLAVDDPEAHRIAQALGFDLADLATDLKKMNDLRLDRTDPKHEIQRSDKATCQQILVALMRSEEFALRATKGGQLSRAGVLALLNAGLGCLKMLQDGSATLDSVFELIRGEVYDITNAADVLKMSVKTALKAREMFVDEEGIRARAQAAKEAIMKSCEAGTLTAEEAASAIAELAETSENLIHERERLSASLKFDFDIGDGSKKTITKKLKEVREAMRAFRYDLDRHTARPMDRKERLRRWCDNIGRRQPTLTADTLAPMRNLERSFNALLSGDRRPELGLLPSAAGAERADLVTDLTHTANNRIRYFFSGKEQKLEAFRQKAHKVLDDLAEKGGSRMVQFEVGADVKAGRKAMGFEGKAGAKFLQTALVKVAPGGGEVTVTYSNGVDVSAEGSVKFGLNDGDAADTWSEANREGQVLGTSVGGKASVTGTRTKTVTYASLEDFIAALKGSSDLVAVNEYKTMACIGKIGSFFRGVGRLVGRAVMKRATAWGFRISKSNEDNAAYVAKMRAAKVMDSADTMLSHREHAMKTQKGTFWTFSGSVGGTGSLGIGSFNGTEKDNDGEEVVKKLNVFSANAGANIQYERDAAKEVKNFRSLLDDIRTHTDDWLLAQVNKVRGTVLSLDGLTQKVRNLVADNAADQAKLYTSIESSLTALEDKYSLPQHQRDWHAFTATLRLLMVACVHLERQGMDVSALVDRLMHPAVPMSDFLYDKIMQQQTNVSTDSTRRFSVDFVVDWDIGSDWVTDVGENLTGDVISDVGADVGAAFINSATSTAIGVQTANIRGKWTIDKPAKTDNVCPWANNNVHNITIGITPGLTTRMLIEFLARKYVDQHTEIPEKDRPDVYKQAVKDWQGALQEVVGTAALAGAWDIGVLQLAKTAPKLAELLTSPTDVTGSGLEVGLDTDYQKSLTFTLVDWRLTAINVNEMTKVGSSIGVRVEVAPSVGVGTHIKETMTTVDIDRHALVRPSLDNLMGQAEQYVHAGNPEGFRNLVAHNKPGALRLFRALTGRPAEGDDKYFTTDREASQLRLGEAKRLLSQIWTQHGGRNNDLGDRIQQLQIRLANAEAALAAAQDDEQKLEAVGDLTLALTETYMLAREVGGITRDADGNLVNA